MSETTFDVIMVGGGLMGCATAYYLLKNDSTLKVALIETDSTYAKSSTTLSDGNTRIQFNLKENIQMSQYGLEVLDRFAEEMAVGDERPEVAFRRQGNLFLTDEAGRTVAEEGLVLQQSLGCRVNWLTPQEISRRFPLLDPTGCVGGTFGPDDGTMDPNAVLLGYKKKAISLGAHFIEGQVTELTRPDNRVSGVKLASGDRLRAKFVLNSAGAWAGQIAQTAGVQLPVQPVKRQVFVLQTNAHAQELLPLTVFPSGLYLIQEHGNLFTCGKSLPNDPVGFDFSWSQALFAQELWPELVEFVPAFDRLKVVRGWAGLYAVNTFDGNAILGEWPERPGLFLANGFSGHGFQQCHAVGRYLAELMLDLSPSLDLSRLSPRRILDNKPVFENERRLV